MFYLYILRNIHNRLYIGQTDNLQRRLRDHSDGTHGSKFIKDYGAFKLIYSEQYEARAEAMRREKQLKRWTRAKKEALVANDLELLKKL